MAIIGIDLGTTNSLACVYRNGRAELIPNELGEYKTSSAVSVLPDGAVLVGAAAKERLVSHPESTAASFKTWILHVSAKSSGGDYRERLILNPNLHLSEAEQARAMQRIREIQLAAQRSQREQLLLERALRLYEQENGLRREVLMRLIEWFRVAGWQDGSIERERACRRMEEQLDQLEAWQDEAPLFDGFWADDEGEGTDDC